MITLFCILAIIVLSVYGLGLLANALLPILMVVWILEMIFGYYRRLNKKDDIYDDF